MQLPVNVIVSGVIGAASVALQFYIGVSNRSRLQGEFGERVTQNGKDIEDLKQEQVRQWTEMTDHGQRIAKIEGAHASAKRANGAAHS